MTTMATMLTSSPVASLSLQSGRRSFGCSFNRSPLSLSRAPMARSSSSSSSLLHSSFLSFPSASLSFPSSFSGLSLGIDLGSNKVVRERYRGLQVRAGKAALCMTKRSRSRKSLARTHGFRRRMRTTSGRALLKRRRAKGRKVLCTKSNPSSGKRA
ncbi:50S ribosomal protein L34, chloroplastic-like [Ananas comosus]|uniref:Large ribosomal subunit protein bL34c n=1 Tax=Ananas comosus TaxID=4615 RepID=A0A6P5H2D0_ANACO|nr:50S ribosomal protein L34, chloroplastic-like [Ananas comosus]